MHFSFHILNFKQTINNNVYEYQSKGGRIMLLCLIAGFLVKYFEIINLGVGSIVGISVGACLLWDVITAMLFVAKCKKLLKKETKAAENIALNDSNTFAYLIVATTNNNGTIQTAVVSDTVDGQERLYALVNKNDWSCVKSMMSSPNLISKGAVLNCVPMSLKSMIDQMRALSIDYAFVIDECNSEKIISHSKPSINDLNNMLLKHGDYYVPQWTIDLRNNKSTATNSETKREVGARQQSITLPANQHIKDFHKLMDLIFGVNGLHVWDKQEAVALAYAIEWAKFQLKPERYVQSIQQLTDLAKEGQANELAFKICDIAYTGLILDRRMDQNSRELAKILYDVSKVKHGKGMLNDFGIVPVEYAPSWFENAFCPYIITNDMLHKIVYSGESENQLIEKLLTYGPIDWSNRDELLPTPRGVIEIKEIHKDSWIAKRKGFMGWNIQSTQLNMTKENNKIKREELIEIVRTFFSEVQSYPIFEIPDACYLKCFENLKNKLNQCDVKEDDRFVTYGRLSFLKEELTKRLADEELKKFNPNWKNKWDNRMGAFMDLSDYIRGDRHISLAQIPEGKNHKEIMYRNDEYYREGFICKKEQEILLEMINELAMFITNSSLESCVKLE